MVQDVNCRRGAVSTVRMLCYNYHIYHFRLYCRNSLLSELLWGMRHVTSILPSQL